MLLILALLSNSVAFAKRPVDPAVMKAKIEARGVGQGVRVSLADKTEAKGLIVAIGDRSFTLKSKESKDLRQIEFTQLRGVHNDHLTRGQKVGIVTGIVAAGVIITALIIKHAADEGLSHITI
jgi:hypothetical protein